MLKLSAELYRELILARNYEVLIYNLIFKMGRVNKWRCNGSATGEDRKTESRDRLEARPRKETWTLVNTQMCISL